MTNVILATKTKRAIEEALERDQGGAYRTHLGNVLPHIGDAYRGTEDGFRSHLGGSLMGRECARELWYGFRWARKPTFQGRILRLFNRGHLEEGRFIALLLTIGVAVYQQDENGNQFRISSSGGHVGGSLDGIVVGIPDLPQGTPALCEFKTHGDKSFKKLVEVGVRSAKFEHFVQMQLYMAKRGLGVAIYIAVNKNDDDLYCELINFMPEVANEFFERGDKIVFSYTAPEKIHDSAGWFKCKFCDYKDLCHGKDKPEVNCRTCKHSTPAQDGTWICEQDNIPWVLTKENQLKGCSAWEKHNDL